MRSTSTSVRLFIEVHAAAGKPSFDWTALAPTFLTVLAGVAGWVIVERFARSREVRAELREMMKSFGALVEGISNSAVEFYGLPGSSPQARTLANRIRADIASIAPVMAALNDAGLTFDAKDLVRLFRQAVTGGQFDSINRPAAVASDPIFTAIVFAAKSLTRKVQLAYYERYVRQANIRWWTRR